MKTNSSPDSTYGTTIGRITVRSTSLSRVPSALAAMEYLQTGARCTGTQVLAAFAKLAPSKVA